MLNKIETTTKITLKSQKQIYNKFKQLLFPDKTKMQ